MKLAELKRVAKNYTWTMFRHDWYPDGKLMGIPRAVEMSNTVGLVFTGGSHLAWGTARNMSIKEELDGSISVKFPLNTMKDEYMGYNLSKPTKVTPIDNIDNITYVAKADIHSGRHGKGVIVKGEFGHEVWFKADADTQAVYLQEYVRELSQM